MSALILIFAISCSKEDGSIGPQGIAGVNGQDGANKVSKEIQELQELMVLMGNKVPKERLGLQEPMVKMEMLILFLQNGLDHKANILFLTVIRLMPNLNGISQNLIPKSTIKEHF